jgi:hypothetical protein
MAIQDHRYNVTNLTAAGTYNLSTTPTAGINQANTLAPGRSVLHLITINTLSTGSITVYDASGSVTGMPKIATFAASSAIGTYHYHANVTNGIAVVMAQAGDVTVSWSL